MITVLCLVMGLPCGLYVISAILGSWLKERATALRSAELEARRLRVVPRDPPDA